MKRFKDKRKVLSLTIVGIAYALIVLPLIISNIQKQQNLHTKAQVAQQVLPAEINTSLASQSVLPQCTVSGKVELGVAYTNTDTTRSIVVTATDAVSNQSINLGTIAPQETKTGTIATSKSNVTQGTINYTVAYVDTPNQTTQKTVSYFSKSCTTLNILAAPQSAQATANASATCGNVTTDVILIIDRSGSMGQNNKLVQAKNAAKNFIDVVTTQESTTRIGLVAFSTTATLTSPLTTDVASLKSKIDALTASGNTCHECGIKTANTEIATHGRAGVKKVVLLLTDGEANYIDGGTAQVAVSIAESKALDAVKAGFTQSNTIFFTIGFDIVSATAPQFLTNIASLTGGKYYFPAPTELDGVYQEISQLIGKGLLGGFVFNDTNVNGMYDTNEPKLSGWTVNASYAGGTKTATTDANGAYTIAGLCDGSYKLSQTMKTGWTQTLPTNSAPFSIDITNASQYTDKVFGNTDKARCNDGIDNDNNGFKDIDDSTCHSDGNPKNPNSYVPSKDGEHGGGNTCSDSKDNNNNALIDGADPVCHTGGNPNNPYDPNLPETILPDLTIIGATDSLDNSSGHFDCTKGEGLAVSIKNQGQASVSGSFVVKVDTSTIVTISSGLNIGEIKNIWIPYSVPGIPTNIVVDANNQILESNETNNTFSQQIPIPSRPIECTVTPTPSATSFRLNVLLDGIGSRGDNANPTNSSLSNKNPKHPTIGADVQIFTLDNQIIASGTGSITYDSVSGSYKGDLPVQLGFPSGKYTIKIKADTYLRRLVTGIQDVVAGQNNQVTQVSLVAGDVNNDNKLNILDYNLLLDCYSDLSPAISCAAAEKQVKTDINDDGLVNQIDYNLFIREISTQPGQ